MKNNKIKIETGSEKLTKEEIDSHKDFNKVYKTYTTTKTNTVKSPKKFGGMTTMVVVTTTVVVTTIGAWKYWNYHKTATQPKVTASTSSSTKSNTASTTTAKSTVKHPYIHPPIKGVDVPYKTYSVDANKGGTITYNNSKIVIPASSFCDANGKAITGKVDIKYREFRNAAEFFASGIPMTYDSAGKQYTFESAGMLDVRGYQNGKPVYVRTGKEIQVSMVTTQRSISYNMYELDTNKQNWTYLDKSKSTPIATKTKNLKDTTTIPPAEQKQVQQIQSSIASIKQEEAAIEKTKPVEPKKVTAGRNNFNIDADQHDYPELAVYKNLLWEPDPADKNYKPSYAAITWDDASLKRSADGTTYTFTVKKGAEQHSFIVHPVFEGKDYDAAMKEYDKKYQDYQVAYDKRKADEKKQQEAYEALLTKIKKDQEEEQQNLLAHANLMGAVTNMFYINNFGIYNTDCPENLPHGAEVTPQYTDNNSDNLNYNEFYLVEKDKNAIYDYHPGHNCRFNPKVENFAWMITPDNKLAIYSIEDFSKIGITSGTVVFKMKVLEKPITSVEDLKAAFKPYLGDLDKQWGSARS